MRRRTLLWLGALTLILGLGAIAQAAPPIGAALDAILTDFDTRLVALETAVFTTTTTTEAVTTTTLPPTTTTLPATTTTTVPANVLNVKDFGARGDGVTDDRAALDAAVQAAQAQGLPLYVPTGRYKVVFTAASPNIAVNSGDLTLYGDGAGKSYFDVYPKTVTSFGYAFLYDWKMSAAITLRDVGFIGPETTETASQPATYLIAAYGGNDGTTTIDIVLDRVRTLYPSSSRFFAVAYMTGGHGGITVLDSEIYGRLEAIANFESAGKWFDRYTVIERSTLAAGFVEAGRPTGITVYNHPHVALHITDSVLKDNPRGAAKQYGEGVAYLTPAYSVYDGVSFVNNADFTLITPGAPGVVTYIRNSTFDGGRIGLRSDTVIEDSTFAGDARLSLTVYAQPTGTIDLTLRRVTFALPESQAIPAGLGSVVKNQVSFGQ